MKKVSILCMVLTLLVAFSTVCFAADGGFVSSPSVNPAPNVVKGDGVTVTPYSGRNDLDEGSRKDIENAYQQISGTDDLTTLNDDLKQIAANNGINPQYLSVSDLFNIGTTDSSNGTFDVTLSAETLSNFVALMRFDGTNWHVVDGAKITADGHLTFATAEAGAFAIVVNTNAGTNTSTNASTGTSNGAAQTGDNTAVVIGVMMVAVSCMVVALSLKKRKA